MERIEFLKGLFGRHGRPQFPGPPASSPLTGGLHPADVVFVGNILSTAADHEAVDPFHEVGVVIDEPVCNRDFPVPDLHRSTSW